jgi:predicted unusual protein kinase regulating ubiquinone biosynthesis (AarF/ABC1/UbiB family)
VIDAQGRAAGSAPLNGSSRGRLGRVLEIGRTARNTRVLNLLRELGVVGSGAPATREGARELRRALEELGVTYVKLGQLLSSRPDLMPDVYIDELSLLTDDASALPFSELERSIAEDIGFSAFTSFDVEPLASASIAQVHRAVLRDGRDVVVKVRKPGIEEQVALDLDLLRSTAALLVGRSETARVVQAEALVEDLDVHLRGELNLMEEAHNADLIAALAEGEEAIVVPAVIRPYVSDRVLVLEWIEGDKISADHGLSPERARTLAESFFAFYVRQVALEGVYHADPHRGNVLLTPDRRLALLDFGLLGRLDDDTRRAFALLLLAVADNRSDDVADQILELSLTPLDADESGFIHDLRRKLPRYHWRALSDIRTGDALADLQRTAIAHRVRLPTSFALVGKTLAQADEIARTLDPQLDPVRLIREQSSSIVSSELRRRLDPASTLASLAPQLEALTKLPRRIGHVVERLESGTLKVGIVPTDLADLEHIARSVANRIGMALIIVGLLLSSALMARVSNFVSLSGFCIAGVLGLYMIWKIIRTPGEL